MLSTNVRHKNVPIEHMAKGNLFNAFFAIVFCTLMMTACDRTSDHIIHPETLTVLIEKGKLLEYPESVIPKDGKVLLEKEISEISNEVFEGSEKLTAIDLSHVDIIDNRAFKGARNLKSVTMGLLPPQTAQDAFLDTSRDKVLFVPEQVVKDYLIYARLHGFGRINGMTIGTLVIDGGFLKGIDPSAIDSEGLLQLPENITVIDREALKEIDALKRVIAPGVKMVEEGAFEGSTNLISAELKALEQIGPSAFKKTGLKELTVGTHLPQVASGAFEGTGSGKSLYYERGVETQTNELLSFVEKHGFTMVNGLDYTAFVIEDGKIIKAFPKAVPSDGHLTLSADVTEIGDFAFQDCKNLKVLTALGVEKIGANSFVLMEGLQEIDMPALRVVGEAAFDRCLGLKTINAPLLEDVADRAFLQCQSLKSIDLRHAKKLGHKAFADIFNTFDVLLGSELPITEADSFSDVTKANAVVTLNKENHTMVMEWLRQNKFLTANGIDLETASLETNLPKEAVLETLPDGTYKLVDWGLPANGQEIEVILPPEVTVIGERCFEKRQSLEYNYYEVYKVVAPGVKKLEKYAFSGQFGMTYFEAPNLEEIGERALGYNSVKTFNFPKLKRIEQFGMYELQRCSELNIPLIEYIGDNAFIDSRRIDDMYLGINPPKVGTAILDRKGIFGVAPVIRVHAPKDAQYPADFKDLIATGNSMVQFLQDY